MAKKDFNDVLSSFEAVQYILFSILCPSILRQTCKHGDVSPLLCSTNTTFSSSYVLKGRLQSLLRMCDRFVMKSLLKTSFQSHGVNENTRGRLNRSLLYCKEWWCIKSWHKNCCFESLKIKQLILDFENAANRVAWRFNYSRSVAFASDAVGFVRDFESHYRIFTSRDMLTG